MSPAQADRSSPASAPLPLIPLAGWAVAFLAYHAAFAAGLITYPRVVGTAFGLLPSIVGHGVLRLHMALLSAALWGIAIGAGMAILRRAGFDALTTGERVVFGGAVGMGILSLATFLAGSVPGGRGWLFPALLVVVLVALAAFGLRDVLKGVAAGRRWLSVWRREGNVTSLLVAILGLVIIFIAVTRAHVPITADYDSLEYHLGAPAQWQRAGRVFFIRDVVYTNFPQNTEMLYLLAMTCFGGPMMGAAVGWQVGVGFVLLAAGAVAACGRRLASATAGRAGAAIFLTTPMLAELGTQNSYVVELPMTAYSFLALFAFLLLRSAESARARWRYAALCGVMAGLAAGCKYPAVLFVVAPVLAFIIVGGIVRLATLRRSLAEAGLVGVVAVLVASPWLVRNAVNTGNPIYPLLHRVGDEGNWTAQQEAKFAKAHGPRDVSLIDLGRSFWRFAIWRDQPGGEWQPPWRAPAAPLLFLFALVPVALGDPRSTRAVFYVAVAFLAASAVERFAPGTLQHSAAGRNVIRIALAAGVLTIITSPAFLLTRGNLIFLSLHFVLWFAAWYALTHRIDRFLDPATPAVAVLAGIGVVSIGGRWPRRVANGVVVAGLAFAAATTLLIHGGPLAAGLALPADDFLHAATRGSTYCHPAVKFINERLEPDAAVLFVGEARTFYCRRRVIAASVFDRQPIDRILDSAAAGDPVTRLRDGLRALGVTHIYVNWAEIKRLGESWAYRFDGTVHNGFSEYINLETREPFATMVRRRYLGTVAPPFAYDDGGLPLPYPVDGKGRPVFVIYELR